MNTGTACATVVILFTLAVAFLGFSGGERHLEQACARYAPTDRACVKW